eukprot:9474588-Pyramimonas_sp.AAC.1
MLVARQATTLIALSAAPSSGPASTMWWQCAHWANLHIQAAHVPFQACSLEVNVRLCQRVPHAASPSRAADNDATAHLRMMWRCRCAIQSLAVFERPLPVAPLPFWGRCLRPVTCIHAASAQAVRATDKCSNDGSNAGTFQGHVPRVAPRCYVSLPEARSVLMRFAFAMIVGFLRRDCTRVISCLLLDH